MSTKNKMTVSTLVVEEFPELGLDELCQAYSITPNFIEELVEFGILDPNTARFDSVKLRRIRTVLHLQQDLDVNLAGAALAIDLLEELDQLRTRIQILERQFQK